MESDTRLLGRRERSKQDKRGRIVLAARELLGQRGVSRVTTQQIADRADVAISTLYSYAATKAELLIMVENENFGVAIDEGLAASSAASGEGVLEDVTTLLYPVVAAIREHFENGRAYVHELVFGDPSEPNRRAGLAMSSRLEAGIADRLARNASITHADAELLARTITAIIQISATTGAARSSGAVVADIREQIRAILHVRRLGSTRIENSYHRETRRSIR